MPSVLTPSLRPLDERVLGALTDRGQRADTIAALLFGEPYWECERCGKTERERMWGGGREKWLTRRQRRHCMDCWDRSAPLIEAALLHPLLIASPQDTTMVWQILRGLECVGRARQAGGWWRLVRDQR
jgi:hypothetical protein